MADTVPSPRVSLLERGAMPKNAYRPPRLAPMVHGRSALTSRVEMLAEAQGGGGDSAIFSPARKPRHMFMDASKAEYDHKKNPWGGKPYDRNNGGFVAPGPLPTPSRPNFPRLRSFSSHRSVVASNNNQESSSTPPKASETKNANASEGGIVGQDKPSWWAPQIYEKSNMVRQPSESKSLKSKRPTPTYPLDSRKKIDPKPKLAQRKAAKRKPFIDYKAVNALYKQSSGWKQLVQESWYYNREKVAAVTYNNTKTGDVQRYVQGGRECKAAAAAAAKGVASAQRAVIAAWDAYLYLRTRRLLVSCQLKLHLRLMRVRKKLWLQKLMKIQGRVEEKLQLYGGCEKVQVDLPNRRVRLLEAVEFKPGKAIIKSYCNKLMEQLYTAIRAIDETCAENSMKRMNFRVEGHTARSKLSKDHGRLTSTARAAAVVDFMTSKVEDGDLKEILWPQGFGDRIPPQIPGADPRRVKVKVMSAEEVTIALWRKSEDSSFNKSGKMALVSDKQIHKYMTKWKTGALGTVKDYQNKLSALTGFEV